MRGDGNVAQCATAIAFIAIIPLVESLSVIIQTSSKNSAVRKYSYPRLSIITLRRWGGMKHRVTMRFWLINAIGAITGLAIFLADSKLPPLNSAIVRDLLNTILR